MSDSENKNRAATDPVLVILQQLKSGDIKLLSPNGDEWILSKENAFKHVKAVVEDESLPAYDQQAAQAGIGDDPIEAFKQQVYQKAAPMALDWLVRSVGEKINPNR